MGNRFYNKYSTPAGVFQKKSEALKANNISSSQFHRNVKDKENLEYFVIETSTIECKGCNCKISVEKQKAGFCSNKCRTLKINYNMNIDSFNDLLNKQDNRCKICQKTFNDINYPCVDHCHDSGRVRGLLCNVCNRGIGLLNDNFSFLQSAAKYLSGESLKISKVRDVKTPLRSTKGSAGIDFFTPFDINEIILNPHEHVNIPSGIKANVPEGFMLTAFNKSGMAIKGFDVGACVVDSDYMGEIHLHVRNVTNEIIKIEPGQKLVQFILIPVSTCDVEVVSNDELFTEVTERGSGGFGSTGTK